MGLVVETEWLTENKIELQLLYKYDMDQSIVVASPKHGRYDVPLSFYGVRYNPEDGDCYMDMDSKVREVTFRTRRELDKYIKFLRAYVKNSQQ